MDEITSHNRRARYKQFMRGVDVTVQRFFEPMSWDERRALFVGHLADYLDAYRQGVINSADLGEILDMFVVGFGDEYKKSELLCGVPILITYLTEDDSREQTALAIS